MFNSFETNYIAHSRVNSAADVWLLDLITHKDLVMFRQLTHASLIPRLEIEVAGNSSLQLQITARIFDLIGANICESQTRSKMFEW